MEVLMVTRSLVRAVLAGSTIALFLTSAGSAQQSTARPSRGADHTARQARPISLGVSGGNSRDLANGYCCSGTLGALVQKGGQQFILSNTHVFAGDWVVGGNGRVAAAGDDINQSGLIDVGCQVIAGDMVADLTDWAPINSIDNVDAAIAAVRTGQVKSTGEILEIGTPANTTAQPFVGQAVKKSGRTTGLTRSSVSSLNASITVGYSDECAGGSYSKTFTGQVIIRNKGSRFLAGGDSGSLMVEDVATNPRAVGLLYAGSSSVAIANPINHVLTYFGVTMVGGAASAGSSTADETGPASARGLARAIAAQNRNERALLNVPGAIGHAVGAGNSPVVQILVREITPAAQRAAPRQVDGIPVVLEEVGDVQGMPFCSRRSR
jgi:hypothetical protein